MNDQSLPPDPDDEPVERPLSPAEALASSPPVDSASIGKRAAARIVDTVLVVGLTVLIGLPFVEEGADGAAEVPLWLGLVGALFGATYEVGSLVWRGQTPGKIALGLKVITVPGGQIPGLGEAVRRWMVPGLLLSLFGILGLAGAVVVYFSAAIDKYHRGLHDKVARTRVIDTSLTPPDEAGDVEDSADDT